MMVIVHLSWRLINEANVCPLVSFLYRCVVACKGLRCPQVKKFPYKFISNNFIIVTFISKLLSRCPPYHGFPGPSTFFSYFYAFTLLFCIYLHFFRKLLRWKPLLPGCPGPSQPRHPPLHATADVRRLGCKEVPMYIWNHSYWAEITGVDLS